FLIKPVNEQDLIYRVGAALASAETNVVRSWHQTIFNALPDSVLVTDQSGCYLDGNAALLNLLGYDNDDQLKLPSDPLLKGPNNWLEPVRKGLEVHGNWQGKLQIASKAGSMLELETRMSPAIHEGDAVYVWVLSAAPAAGAAKPEAKPTIERAPVTKADL